MKTPKGVNSMIEIQLIDEAHKKDICLKNDSFPLYGRLVPSYNGKQWSYTTQKFPPEECGEMTFPDEPYDYDKMAECTFFVGAYDGERCVGLAVLERGFFKYLYLSDLKVASGCRGRCARTSRSSTGRIRRSPRSTNPASGSPTMRSRR